MKKIVTVNVNDSEYFRRKVNDYLEDGGKILSCSCGITPELDNYSFYWLAIIEFEE